MFAGWVGAATVRLAAHAQLPSSIICTCLRLTFSAPGINEVESHIVLFCAELRPSSASAPPSPVLLLQQGSRPKAA